MAGIARRIAAWIGYPVGAEEPERAPYTPPSLDAKLKQIHPHLLKDVRVIGRGRPLRRSPGAVRLPSRIGLGVVRRSGVAVSRPSAQPEQRTRTQSQRGIRKGVRGRSGGVSNVRALVGGRATQDLPSIYATKAYGIVPPPNHDLDWRMQALDDGTLDKQSPAKIMEMLADISPEVSRALWDFLRLANPGYKFDVFKPNTETTDAKAYKVVSAFWERIKVRQGTADVLIGRLFIGAFMRGALFAELVMDKSGTMGLDIATPDPATVRFKASDDPVNTGPWILGQWQQGKFVELTRETIQYIPVDPFPNSPYGRPMMAPAMFSTLFLIGLLHDLRRVIAQQGYPRIDVVVHLDQIFKRMPERIRDSEADQEQWARDAITEIQEMYRSLQPDDALVHDDSFEVKGPVGTVDSSSLGSVDGIITMLERMAVRSLKTMPLVLCITDGVSEANANRQWEIFIQGIKAIQHNCETLLERLLELELQAEGLVADVRFRFSENRSAEELRDQQTLQVKIDNYLKLYQQGIVDQDEIAMTLVGHPPAEEEPLAPAVPEGDKTGGSEEDPEPGSKRAMANEELTRFRAMMESRGYGRFEETYKSGRRPRLEDDDRIVAIQRNGRVERRDGNVYYGWDIYVSVDGVAPKGTDAPLATVPGEVEVTDDDAGRAVALWDRELPDQEGLLEATPV